VQTLYSIPYYQCSYCRRAFGTEGELRSHVEPGDGHGAWSSIPGTVFTGGYYVWAPTNTNISISKIVLHDDDGDGGDAGNGIDPDEVWVGCRVADGNTYDNDYGRFLEACFPSTMTADVERELVKPDTDEEWKQREPILKFTEVDAIVHKLTLDSVLVIRLPESAGNQQAQQTRKHLSEYLEKALGRRVPVMVLLGEATVEVVEAGPWPYKEIG